MRKTRWRNRKGAGLLALALTLALAFSVTGALESRAADPIDLDAECTLTVDGSVLYELVETDYDEIMTKPQNVTLTVDLYKVAEINESGGYTALAQDFVGAVLDDENQTGLLNALQGVTWKTTAEEWQEMAAAAESVVKADGFSGTPVDETKTITEDSPAVTFGKVNIESTNRSVNPGLYLVVPGQVDTPFYTYNLDAFLVALPGNNYKWEETEDGVQGSGDDAWVDTVSTDITTELKVERVNKEGELYISKSLTEFSGLPGSKVETVFQIDIMTLEGESEQRFVSFYFDGTTESEPVLVPGIPAGADVTVTEVYAGAGYELADGSAEKWIIEELPAVTEGENGGAQIAVFHNQPDGSATGGSGITNRFYYENGWKYEQQKGSNSTLPNE